MKLASLQIERFGARSHLKLDDLSEQLNVIYGPNGSGKTTIIQFIKWIIFGSRDRSSHRYLSGGYRAGGSLEVIDEDRRRRRISRYHEPPEAVGSRSASYPDTRYGDRYRRDRLLISGQPVEQTEAEPRQFSEHLPLTHVGTDEYQCVFSFGFDHPPAIEQLLNVAGVRQFGLAHDAAQAQRLEELRSRLNDLLRDAGSPVPSIDTLLDRRQQLHIELNDLEHDRSECLRASQRKYEQLASEIGRRRRHLDELQSMLQRIEANIQLRRDELQAATEEVQQTRKRWEEQRQQEVADIDYQLQQWYGVLDAIRVRHERLQSQLAQAQPSQSVLPPTVDDADLHRFLRSLGYRIDDIDNDLHDFEWLGETDRQSQRSDYLRSILSAALHTMHDDVQRLSHELRRQQTNSTYHDAARERESLRRCEAELGSLIEALNQRRQAIRGGTEYAELEWSYDETLFHAVDTDAPYRQPVSRPWYDLERTTSEPATTGCFVADPVLEARLTHLQKRRDFLLRRINDQQHDLLASEHRLEALRNGSQPADSDSRMEALRRELESIDQQMRQAEAAQRRGAEIEVLERQINDLQRSLAPSEILRVAAGNLDRMTIGAYRTIRVQDHRKVLIEDDHGRYIGYQELSRGTQDQVYLSLALAMIAAYRDERVQLPVMLNDIFSNIDRDRAPATAEVIAEFAAQGHQLILFTRHEHVLQRFQSLSARSFTLRERHAPRQSANTSAASFGAPSFGPRTEPSATAHPRADVFSLDRVTPSAAREPIRPRPNHAGGQPAHDWIAQWDSPTGHARRHFVPGASANAAPAAPSTADQRPNWASRRGRLPIVSEHSLLVDVEWLDPRYVEQLRDRDVETVLQFLDLEPEDGQRYLAAFSVPAALIFRWQSELALQSYVGLTANDAALLVACGVDDPEELAYIDVSELHRRIGQYLTDSHSRRQFGSLARYERSRLSRWIQTARNSHYRRFRHRWDRYRNGSGLPLNETGSQTLGTQNRPEARPREARQREAQRVVRSPQPTPQSGRQPAAPRSPAPSAVRFYLELTDPVVDAPSIGPKTAERFHAVNVNTIQQLLELDPDKAAEKIAYRRITPQLIRTWQLQTTLVCRIPGLRGHDAQILVACDVPTPEALAKMSADSLLTEVTRFVATPEGKRVIRSAKVPDLDEVTRWIQWAQQARDLDSVQQAS